MSKVTLHGTEIKLSGIAPKVGEKAPEFTLVGTDLKEIKLSDFAGKRVIFNVFPSVDTEVCANQLRNFNQKVQGLDNTVLVFASKDLPFAFKRFCAVEGIDVAVTGSDFRYQSVDKGYGLAMQEGALAGLYARAVFVLDENHDVLYAEVVEDVAQEPNYEKALAVL